MKRKQIHGKIFAAPLLFTTSVYGGDYYVKKGDTFTSIVEKEAIANKELNYQQMLELVLKLNNKKGLASYDFLPVGTLVKLPARDKLAKNKTTLPLLTYVVKKGDTFTKIVQNIPRPSSKVSYGQMLSLMLKVNKKKRVSDFNQLKIGQQILLPTEKQTLAYLSSYKKAYPKYWEPSAWKAKGHRIHTVKLGDSLTKISKEYFQYSDIYGKGGSLGLLRYVNPLIRNTNKIFVGQQIIVPSVQQISEYIEMSSKKRMPASQKAAPAPNVYIPFLKEECHGIAQKRCYDYLNKKLLRSKTKEEVAIALKRLRNFATEYRHEKLSEYFSSLANLNRSSKSEAVLLQNLHQYFARNYDRLEILKIS